MRSSAIAFLLLLAVVGAGAEQRKASRPPIIDVHVHAQELWANPGEDAAPFLSAEQQRDIMCRNAARFLRLDQGLCN